MKRIIPWLLVLAMVIAGGVVAYRFASQGRASSTVEYDTVTAEQGDLISTVNASGTMEPEAEVLLVFKTPGRVAEVAVEPGQAVEAGDLIARLESDDLGIALAQAEINLAIAQAQLAKLKAGASAEDLAAAEASLSSAQASVVSAEAAAASAEAAYNDLVAGPSADQKQVAAANLERARILRDQAQAAYDQVASAPNIGMLPQSLQLQQATVDYNAAQANYRQATSAPTQAQLAAARAQIAQAKAAVTQAEAAVTSAQSNLERLRKGASQEDLAIAEGQVTQAQLAVQQARLAAENSELRAPIDGIVSQLNVKPGEIATQATPAATVTNIDQFHIKIQVDEIDIDKISEGQPVRIALDSAPEAAIAGHVDYIASTPTTPSNVVSYEVIVLIDDTDRPLRSGLSATASIVTEELRDVLVIPNRSIQIDRTSGRAFVEKLVDGAPVSVEVQLGARNEQQSQVLGGLQVGDQVVIGSSGAFDQIRQSFLSR